MGNKHAIIKATQANDLINVIKCIDKGDDVNVTDSKGNTSLMIASYNGYKEIACHLIENGADVDISNTVNRTAVMQATSGNHYEIVKKLVDHGADFNNRRDKWRQSAYEIAKSKQHQKIIELMQSLLSSTKKNND